MGMVATLVIHPATLTMLAIVVDIVGIILLRTGLGGMWEGINRHKGGRSCNMIVIFLYRSALRSLSIGTGNDWEYGTVGIEAECICTWTFAWKGAFIGETIEILLDDIYTHILITWTLFPQRVSTLIKERI